MEISRKQILLTNDDGIDSPGLWAAAQALSTLGYVTVAAPREQASAAGRSLPVTSDGTITKKMLRIGHQEWPVYAIGGSPAQAVMHAVLEVLPEKPDLVVSGINYGENLGTSLTVSGTVGAAMEGAALGVPSFAVSLEMINVQEYRSNSPHIDFSAAAYFTHLLAKWMLEKPYSADIDLFKMDVPHDATPATPWRITRLGKHRYYIPVVERKGDWNQPSFIAGYPIEELEILAVDSDIYTLRHDRMVSITPLQLDMTAPVDFAQLDKTFRADEA